MWNTRIRCGIASFPISGESSAEGMGATMNGVMGDGVKMGMMLRRGIVMVGLVGVFIYLVVMALGLRRTVQA
jgi:hypothetical protein